MCCQLSPSAMLCRLQFGVLENVSANYLVLFSDLLYICTASSTGFLQAFITQIPFFLLLYYHNATIFFMSIEIFCFGYIAYFVDDHGWESKKRRARMREWEERRTLDALGWLSERLGPRCNRLGSSSTL
ncbi:hypothetical protein EUGRSUZ_A01988 [Eucalyptus grandis]|uniref:Uncharacterized protein n=2 Tax=Eucalyptus grandis TaxID=71139 RepID=A0A059DGM3_EUCGR|nr:hypothetical protein EUGRSUZ_A01988 [Eucalyptus grandis]